MNELRATMIRAASMLTLFAVLGGGLVALSFQVTHEQIKKNERMTLLRSLNDIVPHQDYDNDLLTDTREVNNLTLLGTAEPVIIYRARHHGQPVAAIFTAVAPDGYNGMIRLLVGIRSDGTIAGVRVVSHQETPGLGDIINLRRSSWILGFNGHSLSNPKEENWKVKRDGGVFDHQTGATITPRAVVKAVKNTLLFYQQFREEVF